MTENETCYLCMRITKADVLRTCFKLWKSGKAREIGNEAAEILKAAYLENRTYFCGKTKGRILGGLLYTLNKKYFPFDAEEYVTQIELGSVLNTRPVSIRHGYQDWSTHFFKHFIWK